MGLIGMNDRLLPFPAVSSGPHPGRRTQTGQGTLTLRISPWPVPLPRAFLLPASKTGETANSPRWRKTDRIAGRT